MALFPLKRLKTDFVNQIEMNKGSCLYLFVNQRYMY